MKKSTQRIIIAASVLITVALFALFLSDILIPFIRLEIRNDVDGAQALLRSKGILGALTVILVEALQEVVVFIPAEFIQISSGLSYPFYIALLLCDIGACLGATIIYVLVTMFRFSSGSFEKNEKKIEKLAASIKKERSAQMLLYLLFIMPLIPFGAICYYGSYRKMKYGRYIFTVATGVIPSIVTSNLMGTAARYFISNDLPLWLLVLIIVLLAGALLAILALFLNKVFFRQNEGTPDSMYLTVFFAALHRICRRRQRLHVDDTLIKDLPTPYIALCNHQSFFDMYFTNRLFQNAKANPSYVVNRHFVSHPLARRAGVKSGVIPKKLFYPDVTVPVQIMRMLKKGYPVIIFPEARLSVDGRSYPIVDRSAAFYRRLNVDLVIVKIRGSYFAKPKWRKRFFRSDVSVSAERVITKDEIAAMTDDELNRLIDEALAYDASADPVGVYKQKDKAKGLENILYRCADCGALYTTKGVGNELICSACGKTHRLNERYLFDGEPSSIGAYYARIKDLEEAELSDLRLEADVDTVIYHDTGKYRTKEKGHCTLDRNGFTYRSARESFTIGFDALPALPFSVNTEFETYVNGDLYYFYPTENRRQVVRWALIVDLIKELRDEENRKEKDTH
jgi:uncharacterized membrane protein YdjX (TVP38/TMEM64 family)